MDTIVTKQPTASQKTAPTTESTRYLGETPFGTVEKVCAVCMVVNDKVADPKMAEKIYNYIQDMFGPESLDYEAPYGSAARHMEGKSAMMHPASAMPMKKEDPLW